MYLFEAKQSEFFWVQVLAMQKVLLIQKCLSYSGCVTFGVFSRRIMISIIHHPLKFTCSCMPSITISSSTILTLRGTKKCENSLKFLPFNIIMIVIINRVNWLKMFVNLMGHESDTFQIWGVKCECAGVVYVPESMVKADTSNRIHGLNWMF